MVKTKQHILVRNLDDKNSLTLFQKLTTISQLQNKCIKVSVSLQNLYSLSSTISNPCSCNCVTIDLKFRGI